jgi:signal transduction histidine kinase
VDKVICTRYDDGDGMLNRQCTGARHSTLTQDGKVLIPTLQGLAIVDPEKMIKNKIFPKVIITSLMQNGTLIDTSHLVFDPGANQYIIEYSANSFTAPTKVVFKHLLEGFDKDWSVSSTDRKVTYTNLPAGTYTFKVLAANNDGVWTKTPAVIQFTVKPYFYEEWWFRVLVLLGLAALVYALIIWRSKQILQQNKELEQLVDQKTKNLHESNMALENQKVSLENTLEELKSAQAQLIQSEKMASLGELTAGIAHEIQNPLNFVNNFSEVSNELISELKMESLKVESERDKGLEDELLNDIAQNLTKIIHHGKRASDIVKGMLEHSRTTTGQKEPTDINALADEYLRLAYHGLRVKDKEFNATIKTDFDESIGIINIIPQDIGRVLLNLINNAFYAVSEKLKVEKLKVESDKLKVESQKSGSDYEPTVSITTQLIASSHLLIAVRDNGNGIPDAIKDKIFQPFFTTKPAGQGTGLGLSLSYDIVKAHGGELKLETKEGEGSEFVISLPINNGENKK